jgi:tetratricopeptide (TPR) repeat protein
LVNILLHAVNALLVWRLLLRLSVPGAWLAAAMFALHPVQVESVAWVTELKSVLSLFFILLALLAWLEFIEGQSRRPWRWYLLALACAALALAAKTTACTLPAALMLILWLRHKPINWPRLAQVGPFLVMGIGMGLLTMWWERYHQGTQGKLFALGLPERILVASHALWFYVGKLLWPVNLTFSYPRWNINPADPLAYGWLAAGAGLGAVIWFIRRIVGRGLEVAALFYVLTLSPVLGFIMLYTFLYTFVADHYQYVACIGPLALVAAGIGRAFEVWGGGRLLLKPVFCGALVLTLGVLTWRQCRMYADAETLWRTTIDRNPASWMAQNNLGEVLVKKMHPDEAILHIKRAIEIEPDYSVAYNNLGNALFQKGQTREAIAQFQKALAIQPDYPSACNNLGIALLQIGKIDEAVVCFRGALASLPDYEVARYNLGSALAKKGQVDEAIMEFQKALAIQPGNVDTHYNLGNALFQKGRVDEAIVQFRMALTIQPDNADAHNNLGTALLQKGQLDEAISEFRKTLAIQPDKAEALYNLGNALFKQGQLDEAITEFQKALAIEPGLVLAQTDLTKVAWVLATSPGSIRPERGQSGQTGPTNRPAFRWHESGNGRHAGGGLCGSGTISRSHHHRAARHAIGHQSKQHRIGCCS